MMLGKRSHIQMVTQEPDQSEVDLRLVAACVRGDHDAEQKLLLQVFPTVFRTVSYSMPGHHAVDDAVQEALLKILRSMKNYRGDCSLSTWVRKISVRTVSYYLHKQRRRKTLLSRAPVTIEPEWPTGDEQITQQEMRTLVCSVLSKLPEKQRVAVELRYVHELGIKEISQIVDAGEDTVKYRLKTGKRTLKKIIANHPAFEEWLIEGIGND